MITTSREDRRFSILLFFVQKANSMETYLCSEECMWILHPRFILVTGHSPLSVRGEDVKRIDSTNDSY